MTNTTLLNVALIEGEYSITPSTKKDGTPIEFSLPVGSAVADVEKFRIGVANSYNHYMVQRFYNLAIAPFEDTDGLTPEERESLEQAKAQYDEYKGKFKHEAFYSLITRVWFNFDMKNVDLRDKAQRVVDILLKSDKAYTFSKDEVKTVNDYLNDLMKPYLKEHDEVKNFTAKLSANDLKRLALDVNAETFQGTKQRGIRVKHLTRIEVWRQFMLFSLAKSFNLWEVVAQKKSKVVELIG